MTHCIVGDVHGEYDTLLDLVAITPLNSTLIFVGDLIDRGAKSAQVVHFVRKHKLACVLGNHELMMIKFGSKFIDDIENCREIDQRNMWLTHGGKETLLSYGLISIVNEKLVPHRFIKDFIFQFKDDIEWMSRLPLYIELDTEHSSGRKVVVSHSAIASVWRFKDSTDEDRDSFENTVLWTRRMPIDSEYIFNVFGHTPQKNSVDRDEHYINIDTGAYNKTEKGFGLLSAYCIETDEVFSVNSYSSNKAI